MTRLVVATRNKGKLREIAAILDGLPFTLLSLDDFPGFPEVEEDGETFEENALKKASAAANVTGLPALADDSGLVVDALGGRPGVYSARYSGETASDEANNAKLLRELASVPYEERTAAFRCAIALCSPEGKRYTFSGELQGVILDSPRGTEGFGYDPLFFVSEKGATMAELPLEVKNVISHRGRALALLKDHLGRQGIE
ncbi:MULTISPECIES: XTP/dITP diphosphatase [Geobacter]|uniref:XTP/dITP diphosphatase n=1 Tax=Geobacter TaxID=28231 RepID=UPI002573DA60|nr:XTP/dITP diphosphatase [Geobacter sulfurreducens]BEH10210.1 XTP/dITP diphosphatase [Geobacter sulfurreducens subsp. ethanolicus]BET58204.1 XTP/dITP diphosphatase [Geobacter sp. 60473]